MIAFEKYMYWDLSWDLSVAHKWATEWLPSDVIIALACFSWWQKHIGYQKEENKSYIGLTLTYSSKNSKIVVWV